MAEHSEDEDVLVQQNDHVLRLTLNKPDALNALSTAMLHRLAQAVNTAAEDPEVRAVVLTGSGKGFSSGANLSGLDDSGIEGTIDAANQLIRALRAIPKPVLSAVNGPAAGVGCSLALAADLTVATESAYFLLAFANVGLMPDGGATAFIPAAIGRARAARMAMLAERIPAPQALEWGLISHSVPDEEFASQVEQLVTRLATGPTTAYAYMKQAFNATTSAQLEQALEIERSGQTALFHTADFLEGVTAFQEKRSPNFRGA